jgi:putative ABC transport system permease protein
VVLRAEDGRGTRGRSRLRSALVAAQIASALVLVTCGALMLRTLANRGHVDLGFDPRGAIRADLPLPPERYSDPAAMRTVVAATLDRLNRLPDVTAAGASTWALPTGAGAQRQFTLPRDADRALPGSIRRGVEAVTPAYFDALGASLKAGRFFSETDRDGTAPVAIVNDELARRLWPDRSPLGERLRLGSATEVAPIVTVVGVVSTIRRSAMHDFVVARVYVPYAQYPNPAVTLVVRARGPVASSVRALQAAVSQTDAAFLLEGVRTVEEDLAQFVAPIRLITSILAGFGAAGLLLAALGVFGTMSYTVSQREREMAVRAALGADRGRLFRLVFWSALRMTAAGIAAGVVIAFAATRALAAFLFGVSPTDPVTFGGAIGFLTLVSFAACYRPAHTAATADPMVIFRR